MAKDLLYLKSIINCELKKKTGAVTNTALTSTGAIVHLTAISQGDTADTRDGETILLKYYHMNLSLYKSQNASARAQEVVRIIVFMWHQQTTPTVTSVLEDVSVYSPYERANMGKKDDDRIFTVLCDKRYALSKTATDIYVDTIDCKLNPNPHKMKHTHFNNANTDNEINGVYMILLAEEAAGSADNLKTVINYQERIRWYDN